jgi:hypothetical protein
MMFQRDPMRTACWLAGLFASRLQKSVGSFAWSAGPKKALFASPHHPVCQPPQLRRFSLVCTMRGEFAIKRAPRNARASTDTLHRTLTCLIELKCHLKCLGIDRFTPSAFPASPSRTGQSRQRPLPSEIALESSANAPVIWKKNCPMGVVVSITSTKLWNPIGCWCSSSEVAFMLEGLLRHGTEMEVEKNYVDTGAE